MFFVQTDCMSLSMIWKPAHIRQITNTNISPIPTKPKNHQYQQITNLNKSPIPRETEMTGSHIRQFWSNQDYFKNPRSWSLCKHSDMLTLVKVKVDLVDFKHVGSLFTSNALENLKISPTTIEAQL